MRQLASRARGHVESGRPRFPASAEDEERIAGAFAIAWQEGALDKLLVLLDPDSVLRSDGGGRVPAAGKPLVGAERVARALVGLARAATLAGREVRGRFARVNGATGLIVEESETTSVVSLTIDAGRIVAVDIVRNPDKLRRLVPPAP